jgi:hypothetical protein
VLAEADVIFINGLKLEEPTLKLAEANLPRRARRSCCWATRRSRPEEYVYDFSFPQRRRQPQPASVAQSLLHALRYAEIMRDTLAAHVTRPTPPTMRQL